MRSIWRICTGSWGEQQESSDLSFGITYGLAIWSLPVKVVATIPVTASQIRWLFFATVRYRLIETEGRRI